MESELAIKIQRMKFKQVRQVKEEKNSQPSKKVNPSEGGDAKSTDPEKTRMAGLPKERKER